MGRARGLVTMAVFAAGVAAGTGCETVRGEKDTNVPLVEEFRPPPNEERFNNPPEMAYRKPAAKQEFKPGFGGPGGPGGGGGGMGSMMSGGQR